MASKVDNPILKATGTPRKISIINTLKTNITSINSTPEILKEERENTFLSPLVIYWAAFAYSTNCLVKSSPANLAMVSIAGPIFSLKASKSG